MRLAWKMATYFMRWVFAAGKNTPGRNGGERAAGRRDRPKQFTRADHVGGCARCQASPRCPEHRRLARRAMHVQASRKADLLFGSLPASPNTDRLLRCPGECERRDRAPTHRRTGRHARHHRRGPRLDAPRQRGQDSSGTRGGWHGFGGNRLEQQPRQAPRGSLGHRHQLHPRSGALQPICRGLSGSRRMRVHPGRRPLGRTRHHRRPLHEASASGTRDSTRVDRASAQSRRILRDGPDNRRGSARRTDPRLAGPIGVTSTASSRSHESSSRSRKPRPPPATGRTSSSVFR